MAAKMPRDVNTAPIQVLRPGATEKISSGGTASDSEVVAAGVDVLRIATDGDIHYALDGAATTSKVYLPAGGVEFIRVEVGDVISVIGTANVYLTSME